MTDSEKSVLDRVTKSAALGGFVYMAVTSWLLAFDVASVATLIADTAKQDILAALIIGGAITKGTVVGGVVGMATLARGTAHPRATRV